MEIRKFDEFLAERGYVQKLPKESRNTKSLHSMKDITQIFNDYYQHIYNFALKLSCYPDDAMDLTQETFIKAWRNHSALEKEEALAGWLRTICYREFLMKMRKEKNNCLAEDDLTELEQSGKLLDDRTPLPEEEVIVAEAVRDLQNGCFLAMVRKLTLNQRIAFSLVDMFGMRIEDVAEILEVTVGAAKGLLYRARMNIDSFFADHCGLIYEKNPCSCEAWRAFSMNREALQQRVREMNRKVDYLENKYHYNEEVRRKIYFLYSHMPEQKPPQEWYQNVIKSFEK